MSNQMIRVMIDQTGQGCVCVNPSFSRLRSVLQSMQRMMSAAPMAYSQGSWVAQGLYSVGQATLLSYENSASSPGLNYFLNIFCSAWMAAFLLQRLQLLKLLQLNLRVRRDAVALNIFIISLTTLYKLTLFTNISGAQGKGWQLDVLSQGGYEKGAKNMI